MFDRQIPRERRATLGCLAALSLSWSATSLAVPHLYEHPGYESPVRASGDDLLLLPGIDLSASDTVVYQLLSDTRSLPAHPSRVPSRSKDTSGVAGIASAADVPFSLTVHLPDAIDPNQSYVLWLEKANGEWSNGVRINDARPLWITPDYAYATAAVAGLPRLLKVVGRNLHPATAGTTHIRLIGPQTYTLAAQNVTTDPLNTSTQLQRYVAAAPLPATLAVGTYTVEVSREGVSWTALIGHDNGSAQTFTVKADPTAPLPSQIYSVGDPLYGIGSDFRSNRPGTACLPDDDNDDTPCVLNAIYAAKTHGGGTISFGPGKWKLSNSSAVGTFTGVPGDGIVVAPNINLQGAGTGTTTVARGSTWVGGSSTFTLQGPNTVSGITFHDDSTYVPSSFAGPILKVGVNWYWATGYGTPAVTQASNIVITGNVFELPFTAIGNGGLPIDHLLITNNVFGGAYQNAIYLGGDGNDTTYRYNFSDSVIAYNTFYPSSYVNPAPVNQGPIASQLGSGLRIDFSNNTADGTSTKYLYNPTDAKGFRAAYFWNTGVANQEMILISRNAALCSGDKVGDGEAIVFDSVAEIEGFPSAQPVISATPWTDANGNPGSSVTVNGSIRTTRAAAPTTIPDLTAYYQGYWLRIVDGTGIGQWRKAVSVSGAGRGQITVNVTPALDVLPARDSRALLGRGTWQTAIVDNFIDQRQPMCTKGNITRPTGGTMSWYASTADSAMEGNQQYDTNGILLAHQYKEVDPGVGESAPFTTTQSSNEVRDNRIDGEYNWTSAASESGIFLGYAATPDTGPPPVISYGISIGRNTIRQADTARGGSTAPVGAIGTSPSWYSGPQNARGANQWKMADSTLMFHNSLMDINGGGLNRIGIGLDAAFSSNQVTWQSVLFANSCSNVQTSLTDYGIGTVRYCPSAGSSCECNGVSIDVGINASIDMPVVWTNDSPTYTATITDNSTGSASGVTVAIKVPGEIEPSSVASSQGNCDFNTSVCKLGTLAGGATATVTLQGRAAWPGSGAAMTFAVTHGEADPVAANDSAAVILDINEH